MQDQTRLLYSETFIVPHYTLHMTVLYIYSRTSMPQNPDGLLTCQTRTHLGVPMITYI